MAQNEKLNFDVTLIDTKTYFENTISVLRLVSTTDQKDQIKLTRELLIKHEDYLKDVHVYMQKVIAVTPTQVITEDETFYFDYLAVCTGSSYPLIKQSGNSEFRLKTLKEQIKIVQDSKIIVVVGGGYVGVELASELAIAYPNTKTVILVQRGDRLLSRGGNTLSKKVLKFLTKAGVTVMLNSNVLNLQTTASEGFCLIQNTLTKEETRVNADKIFNAAGQIPNSKFMERYLGYSLDDRGYIIVNDYFQLSKNSNMFSLGDVCNIPEEKVAERASRHVDFLMKQLRKIVDGQADSTTGTEYSEFGNALFQVTSLGPKEAMCTYGKTIVTTGSLGATSKKLVFNTMMKVTIGESTTEKILVKNQKENLKESQKEKKGSNALLSRENSLKAKPPQVLVLIGVEETRFGREMVKYFLNLKIPLCVAVTSLLQDAMDIKARKQNLFLESIRNSPFGNVIQYKSIEELTKIISPASTIILSSPLPLHSNLVTRASELVSAIKAHYSNPSGSPSLKNINFLHPYSCDLGTSIANIEEQESLIRSSFLNCEKLIIDLASELPKNVSYSIVRFSGDFETIQKFMHVSKLTWSFPVTSAYQAVNFLSRYDLFSALEVINFGNNSSNYRNNIFMFTGPQNLSLNNIQSILQKEMKENELKLSTCSLNNFDNHFSLFTQKRSNSKFEVLVDKQRKAFSEIFERPESLAGLGNEGCSVGTNALSNLIDRNLETFADWTGHHLHLFLPLIIKED